MEVGYFDTYLPNEYGYLGCWSVYPFFESGKIIASDMQSGLFVLTYNSGLSVEYPLGWNLVGLPIAGENMPYNEVFSGVVEGTLYEFARLVFGEERKIRFRCDYFPFVEPGVDMSIDCFICNGQGCRICSDSGWIEIMGAGMVIPRVVQNAGYEHDS